MAEINKGLINMETNHSLTGVEANKLSVLYKLGIGLFGLGVLGIIELISTSILAKTKLSDTENFDAFIIGSFTLMLLGILFFTYSKSHFSFNSIYSKTANVTQKTGLGIGVIGFGILGLSWFGISLEPATLFLWLSLGLMAIGILTYTYGTYNGQTVGIKNNHVWFNSFSSRGALGWLAGVALTAFYIQIYWFSDSLEHLIRLFDPLSFLLRDSLADRWFVYGTIYTFVITFLGIKFIVKYRNNRYQIVRTISVIFFQMIFAYFLPFILEEFSTGGGYFGKDLKNVWPLNYGFIESYQLNAMAKEGVSGMYYFVWGILLFLVVTPFLTYLVGKRWYCSWVCGCGGLAETAGDSFRQLSSKTEVSWKLERWIMHSVMVFVLITTVASLWPYFSGKDYEIGLITITQEGYLIWTIVLCLVSSVALAFGARKYKKNVLLVGAIILVLIAGLVTYAYYSGNTKVFYFKSASIKKVYGFLVGAAFAGVIGVGFYPILGNRVWCRFGCPMAGYMGLFQRFKSRFRITTNGSQCISCGNCSTYCEQGIDVRAYAQKGENIVRSSCVGCGVCSDVCPRGVLKLENGPEEGRFDSNPLIISKDGVKLNM
ncbi:4Fe-4S binding protein [Crocinitomicaceae bacterium]|nr:4Fe-4S binding protein [Crocinitomicaceae bacterium]